MPQHPTPSLADPSPGVRRTTAGDSALPSGPRHGAEHQLRVRLTATRVRAPDTLRARIRRELRAAREAAALEAAARE